MRRLATRWTRNLIIYVVWTPAGAETALPTRLRVQKRRSETFWVEPWLGELVSLRRFWTRSLGVRHIWTKTLVIYEVLACLAQLVEKVTLT